MLLPGVIYMYQFEKKDNRTLTLIRALWDVIQKMPRGSMNTTRALACWSMEEGDEILASHVKKETEDVEDTTESEDEPLDKEGSVQKPRKDALRHTSGKPRVGKQRKKFARDAFKAEKAAATAENLVKPSDTIQIVAGEDDKEQTFEAERERMESQSDFSKRALSDRWKADSTDRNVVSLPDTDRDTFADYLRIATSNGHPLLSADSAVLFTTCAKVYVLAEELSDAMTRNKCLRLILQRVTAREGRDWSRPGAVSILYEGTVSSSNRGRRFLIKLYALGPKHAMSTWIEKQPYDPACLKELEARLISEISNLELKYQNKQWAFPAWSKEKTAGFMDPL